MSLIVEKLAHYSEPLASAKVDAMLRLIQHTEGPADMMQASETFWASVSDRAAEELKLELLDVLIYFIEHCLEDHALTAEEQTAIRDLKRVFRVEEGDLYALKRERIADVLRAEIPLILRDRNVDRAEALHQVSLQRAFDLSYDQYLELTREYVERIVEELIYRITYHGRVDRSEREDLFSQIQSLDTVYRLDAAKTRIIYNNSDLEVPTPAYDPDVPGRSISQEVKDLVWRRDQGRCAKCGSNQRLEFDHIVPFSKGGSSTYRNIQLLCEACNREKSGLIG